MRAALSCVLIPERDNQMAVNFLKVLFAKYKPKETLERKKERKKERKSKQEQKGKAVLSRVLVSDRVDKMTEYLFKILFARYQLNKPDERS